VSRPDPKVFHPDDRPLKLIARNLSATYIAYIVDAIIGLLLLPFNVAHLGVSAYGLWVLTASVTVHFSLLGFGYGGALVRFVAHYRAQRSAPALNEIVSTVFIVFAAIGCVAYGVAALVAFHLDDLFKITAEQAQVGRAILLIIAVQVALNFPFSVFGNVVNGFQRQHVNGVTAVISSLCVAIVNVAVLKAGLGLVPLVLATTAVRVLTFLVYASNAYRAFSALHISPSLFRWHRLKEVTGFSVYTLIIDWSDKLNYQLDQLVIGAFLGTAPVAIWGVADRIVVATQNLTNQLNGVLFPVVVDSNASERSDRLRAILLQGTRLSLATVLPVTAALVMLADPLIRAWVGADHPELLGSVPVLQILVVVVAIRVGAGTAMTTLKGAGRHRMLACVNMATGVANVALSIALVRRWGLIGVAIGTLVPIAFSSLLILYPAACRRVGLPITTALGRAVLPAVWPAVVVGLTLSLTRGLSPATLLDVFVQIVFGSALYLGLFIVAIGARDRAVYSAKALELLGRRPAVVPQ
jgi:O-antigen/teichoic acid export membrane protein